MRRFRFPGSPIPLLVAFILSPEALALDEEDDLGNDEVCHEAMVEGIGPRPYLNGLPLIEEELEIGGDAVKVMVQIPPYCHTVTPAGLPFAGKSPVLPVPSL